MSGKFDGKAPADDSGLHTDGHVQTVHATHAPSDAIVVRDAHLLFNGDFKRSGVDLILSKDDQELVLHDYFKGEKRAALSSPDGAHLSGDIVNALTGHVEYAQADGSASVSKIIGHVTKLAGTATAVRNGVSIILNQGDNVEKGDVVQSGSGSTLGITFIDGTVFGLSSNARMVLNEMVYDPNGSTNASLLSLVAGTITFVAGETAKHGDMKIDTPVATMGIRGTAVLVEIDFTVPGQGGTPDAKFQVLVEPDGTTGSYILFDKTTLIPLAVVDTAGQQINISNGILSQTTNPLSPEIQKLINDVFSLKFSDNPTPQTNTHFTDTPIPPSLAPIKLASGATAIPIILNLDNTAFNSPFSPGPNGAPALFPHIDQPPQAVASGNSFTVPTGTALSSGVDPVSGPIRFTDINAGDHPTVTTHFVSLKLLDAQHYDITATLTSQQIAAVEAQLVVTPSPGNNNNGAATWTYSVADSAFNFLTAGETLTLTYDAVVNNNFLPFEQVAEVPFTITINGPGVVEWIHPTGDLWSVGSNWNSGTVPTATDDVIIPAEHIPGGSGLYDVTIETPAVARTLTLNANNTTGGQVINHSTLTIGETLSIFNDGVLNNLESGTVSVGGQMELLNQSSLLNSGLITLGGGGDFEDQSSVTNSGTIELAGGTLNVEVDIANSGGIIQVDGGTTLKLNGAAIDGGTVNDNGPIDVTADSSINGSETDALLNNGGVTVESGVTLTLDNVTVNGTTFIDTAAGAIIQIDDDTTLTLNGGATIDGGTINDGTADGGTIDVAGNSSINGATIDNGDGTTTVDAILNNGLVTVESDATLTLDHVTVNATTITDNGTIVLDDTVKLKGGATIQSGPITNNGTLEVAGAVSLLNDTLTNTSASGSIIQVDGGQTLTLSGTEIIGGTINDFSGDTGGTIDVTGNSSINGSTIDNGDGTTTVDAILNNGLVTVESGATLTLDTVTVNATTITDNGTIVLDDTVKLKGGATIQSGPITNNGTLEVAGAVSLLNDTLTSTGASGSIIQVDDGQTLTLSGTEIIGGTVNDFSGDTGGTIDVTGDSSINGSTIDNGDGTTTVDAILNNGGVTVESDATLTLDTVTVNATTITDNGTIVLDDTVKLKGGATIQSGPISNNGTLEVAGAASLLNDTLTSTSASGSIIQVDGGQTLTLSGTEIIGGAVNDFIGGTIDVTGSSKIDGNATLNNGGVTVESGVTLALDNVTVNGTTFADTASGAIIQVDSGDTLKLNSAIINGGTVTDNGTIDISGAVTLDSGAAVNGGAMSIASGATLDIENAVTGTGATLNGVDVMNSGTIQVDGPVLGTTTIKLVLDGGTAVTGGTLLIHVGFPIGGVEGTVEIGTGGATLDHVTVTNNNSLTIDDGNTLTLSHVAINGGTINDGTADGGTIDVTGNSSINGATIDHGDGTTTVNAILNNGGVTIESGVTLTLDNVTVNGTVFTDLDTSSTIQIDSGDTLAFNGATVNGGTIDIFGELDSTGVGFISAATIVNSSNIDVTSGTLTIDPTPVTNTGTIEVSGDSTLVFSGETITNGVNGKIQVDAADSTHFSTLDLEGSTISGGAVILSGELDSTGDSFISGAMITNTGTIDVTSGTLDLENATINGTGTITNNGEIDATTGTANVTGNITGTGSIDIFNNAELEIGGSVSSGQTVTFGSAGAAATLILDDSKDFDGTVVGLVEYSAESQENHVDLKDLKYIAHQMSASFDATTDILTVSNGPDSVSLHLSGGPWDPSFEIAEDATGGTLIDDPSASSGLVTIDSGKSLDISVASTATVSFLNSNGNTGELVLDHSKDFTGQIAGFAGDGTTWNSDQINLTDVNIADVAINKTTYTDSGNSTGTLTLYNANGQALDSLTFVGSYQLANFTIESDGSGHALIVDPPVPSGTAAVCGSATTEIKGASGENVQFANTPTSSVVVNDPGPAVNSVIMHDPGPTASSAIVANVSNQTLIGFAASDTFVFNFAGVGHATVTDFHPATDALRLSEPIFASALAALNATHDDGHGNSVVAIDAHDTTALAGVLKAQLHVSDFHVV